MVGNAKDAARALAGSLRLIGEGCSRYVYVSDDETVVYKVHRYDEVPEHSTNSDEYARRNLVVPKPLAVPPMTLYPNGVLAMPYYRGTMAGECFCTPNESHDDTCLPSHLVDMLYTVGEDCATWGNTVWCGETLYLIDLGT